MSYNLNTHLDQPFTEVVRVLIQLSELSSTDTIGISGSALDYGEGGQDLLCDYWRHSVVDQEGSVVGTNVSNKLLGASDVTTHSTERLGKGAHEDIHVLGVDTGVFAHTTASGAHGTDGMGLIEVGVAPARR